MLFVLSTSLQGLYVEKKNNTVDLWIECLLFIEQSTDNSVFFFGWGDRGITRNMPGTADEQRQTQRLSGVGRSTADVFDV